MAGCRHAARPALSAGLLSLIVSFMSAAVTPVMAADFRSIGDRPAVLYDAPAAKATKLHILSPLQPVEIVVKLDKWSKIRDFSGEFAWVDNSALTDKRFVVATDSVEARAQPRAGAPMVFEARRGVVLELTGAPVDGFAPVRHRDAVAGFIAISQLWGL